MINKEYYTIKEVAAIVGVSAQSIYQRLDTTLKEYTKVIKGRKYLKQSVLSDVYNISVQDIKQDIKQDLNKELKGNNSAVDMLQDTINILRQQLETKDEQIKELTKSLQYEQGKTKELQDKLLLIEDKTKVAAEQEPNKNKKWWEIWR